MRWLGHVASMSSKNAYNIWMENLKRSDYLEDLSVGKRILGK
jgi:hypothetical protein